MKKKWAYLCLIVTTACVTPLPNYTKPLDYGTLPNYKLDVAETLIVSDVIKSDVTDYLAKRYGKTPEEALREWLEHRLNSAGTQGQMNVVIQSANFTSEKLNIKDGISGAFKREQEERWTAYLSVMISLQGSAGEYPPAEISVSVHSSQTVPENANAFEKKEIYNAVLNELMTLYNAEAEKQIQQYFSNYFL